MAYVNSGVIDCGTPFDRNYVKGKTAVVTGGANGIGEFYVRELVEAGALVIVADMDEIRGEKLEKELPGSVKFIKCNVTQWSDQLAVFRAALSASPSGRVDIVIANAGISGADSVHFNDLSRDEPEEPVLKVLNVNLIGVLYTIKLALFYFRKQHATNNNEKLDQNLILQGSLAGYVDIPGIPQYTASKYGLRGIMKSLRRTEAQYGVRVNYIAPWFVRTTILSETAAKHLDSTGVEFTQIEDVAQAAMRILSTPSINGRAFGIIPRSYSPHGYIDLAIDDYEDGTLLSQLNDEVLGVNHRATIDPSKQETRTQW